jgi:hypothetical protein
VTSRGAYLTPLLILVAATVGACRTSGSPTPAIGDGGLLSGRPCAAPCFFGIRPGSTTLEDAQKALTDAGVCAALNSFDNISQGGTKGFTCGVYITVAVSREQENVEALGYSPSIPLTVRMLVDGLGPPDALRVIPSGLPEHQRATMLVYYDQSYTRILLPEETGVVYHLEEDTPVERVVYLEKTSFDRNRADASEWAGFGEYASLSQ